MQTTTNQAELAEREAAEKLEKRRELMWQKLHAADPDFRRDDVVVIFDFSLSDHVTM